MKKGPGYVTRGVGDQPFLIDMVQHWQLGGQFSGPTIWSVHRSSVTISAPTAMNASWRTAYSAIPSRPMLCCLS